LCATVALSAPLLAARPLAPPLYAAHFAYGALAGGLYAIAVARPSQARAALFGASLWLIAVAVYAPLCGFGFLAHRSPALGAIALPLHLAWGLLVGALTPAASGRSPTSAAPTDESRRPAAENG
jgi:hypothetical protein